MIRRFLSLEWKSFTRSASFNANLVLKIFMALGALYFIGMFLMFGVASYFILEEMGLEPFGTINRFLIYYIIIDLTVRFVLQKMPVMNIRQLLTLPVPKRVIVRFALSKTVFSFFNWVHLFFLLPFSVVLMYQGFDT